MTMESGVPVLKRTRRHSKDGLGVGQADPDVDQDDEIARLIDRARRLRDRMDLACTMGLEDCNRSMGSSAALELDALSNVLDGTADSDVLFANLFFDQEGADAVVAALERKRHSLQEIREAQDETRLALRNTDDGAQQGTISARVTLSKLVFDRRFPFSSSRPTMNLMFTIPNQKSTRRSTTVSSPIPKTIQSKCVIPIEETFRLTLPALLFNAQDNYIQFTAKCDCEGQQASKPRTATMSGFLSLHGLLDSGQDGGAITRDIDLLSRNRQYRCVLKIQIAFDDEGHEQQLSPPVSNSIAEVPVEYERPPSPRIVQGVAQSLPPTSPIPDPAPVPANAMDLPELAVRPGDLVILQVGIRSAVVTVPLSQRLRYLFVSYQAFPGQTRLRTVPTSDRWCPTLNHLGQIPRLYSQQLYDHLRTSLLVLELWSCASPRPREDHHSRLLGIAKVRLERLLPALNRGRFCKEAPGGDVFAVLNLCGLNGDVEVRDVITNRVQGRLSVMLALGSLPQMSFLGELWRAAAPIQRLVRGFLCRRCLGRLRPKPPRQQDDLVLTPVRDVSHTVATKDDRVRDINRSRSISPRPVGRNASPHKQDCGVAKELAQSANIDIIDLGPSPDEMCLTVECHQAAGLTDPDLFNASLFVKFALDPAPDLPHQSGVGITGLVRGCSHPYWKSHLRLSSKALPSPTELMQKSLLFSLLCRSHQEPITDKCLGRARFSLRKLTVATSENGILEWLDLVNDSQQYIGHLLVKIIPNEIMLSALRDAQLNLPIAAIPESQRDNEPASEFHSAFSATSSESIASDPFRFSSTTFADYAPVQDLPYIQRSYSGPIVTMEDVHLKLKEIGDMRKSNRRPSATLQDLNVTMKELDNVTTRLTSFQFSSLSTETELDRARTRRRSAMVFTPNPKASKPASTNPTSSGPLPQPDRARSPSPSSAPIPIQSLPTSRSPTRRSSSHIKSSGRDFPSDVKSPKSAPLSPVRSPIGSPVRSPSRPSSPVRVMVNFVERASELHSFKLEAVVSSDHDASADAFQRDTIDVEIENFDNVSEPPIDAQTQPMYVEDVVPGVFPVHDQSEPIPIDSASISEPDDNANYIDEVEKDCLQSNLIDISSHGQHDVNDRAGNTHEVQTHHSLETVSHQPRESHDAGSDQIENSVALDSGIVPRADLQNDVSNLQPADDSPKPESSHSINDPVHAVSDGLDFMPSKLLHSGSDINAEMDSSPKPEDNTSAEFKSVTAASPTNSKPKSPYQMTAREVREVALSPIRVLLYPNESRSPDSPFIESNDPDLGSDQEILSDAVSAQTMSADGPPTAIRSRSTNPVESGSLVRRRVDLSYTTSPVTSRESSPGPASDYGSYQSDGNDIDNQMHTSRNSKRNVSPPVTVGLPPLPPKPRPQLGRILSSAEERKRYERIARIFEGRF